MYNPGDILIMRVQRLPIYEHRSTPAYHESTKRVEVRTVVGDAAVAHDYVVKETKKGGRHFRWSVKGEELWSGERPPLRYLILSVTKENRRAMKKNAVGASEIRLYANPYDTSAKGWYFKSVEEFEKKYERHLPVEEYELDWIDGPEEDRELFEALNVGPAKIEEFFELVDDLQTDEKAALYYLLRYHGSSGVDLGQLLILVRDDVRVREGTSKEYVYDLIDDLGGVDQLGGNAVEMYFDYESFGRDLAFDLDEEEDAHYLDMTDQERGEAYVDDRGGVAELGETAERYFDHESYARDLELNGDVTEFDFAGTTYTTDYNG
jgi:antirestriction protein